MSLSLLARCRMIPCFSRGTHSEIKLFPLFSYHKGLQQEATRNRNGDRHKEVSYLLAMNQVRNFSCMPSGQAHLWKYQMNSTTGSGSPKFILWRNHSLTGYLTNMSAKLTNYKNLFCICSNHAMRFSTSSTQWFPRDKNIDLGKSDGFLSSSPIPPTSIESSKTSLNVGILRQMSHLCKIGSCDEATKYLDKVGFLNKGTYISFLQYCLQYGCVNAAEVFFTNMENKDGIHPTMKALFFMIKVNVMNGNIDQAEKYFFRMIYRDRYTPDAEVFLVMMEGYVKSSQILKCMDLLQAMPSFGIEQDENIWKLLIIEFPKIFNGKSLVDEFIEQGRYDYAVRTMKLIKKHYQIIGHIHCNFPVETYNQIIEGLIKQYKIDQLDELLYFMKCEGVKPNQQTYDIILKYSIHARGRKIIQKITHYMEPNIDFFNALIQSFCSEMKMNVALNIFSQLQQHGNTPNVKTYNLLFLGFTLNGELKRATKFLKMMVVERISPNEETFAIISKHYIAKGKLKEAEELMKIIQSSASEVNETVLSLLKQIYENQTDDTN